MIKLIENVRETEYLSKLNVPDYHKEKLLSFYDEGVITDDLLKKCVDYYDDQFISYVDDSLNDGELYRKAVDYINEHIISVRNFTHGEWDYSSDSYQEYFTGSDHFDFDRYIEDVYEQTIKLYESANMKYNIIVCYINDVIKANKNISIIEYMNQLDDYDIKYPNEEYYYVEDEPDYYWDY